VVQLANQGARRVAVKMVVVVVVAVAVSVALAVAVAVAVVVVVMVMVEGWRICRLNLNLTGDIQLCFSHAFICDVE